MTTCENEETEALTRKIMMTTDLDQVIEDAAVDDRLLARTNLFMGLAGSMVAILNSLQGVFGEGKRWIPA